MQRKVQYLSQIQKANYFVNLKAYFTVEVIIFCSCSGSSTLQIILPVVSAELSCVKNTLTVPCQFSRFASVVFYIKLSAEMEVLAL